MKFCQFEPYIQQAPGTARPGSRAGELGGGEECQMLLHF